MVGVTSHPFTIRIMSTQKKCPKCGACWMGDQLYWATGKPGKDEDLAGLVCNNLGDDTCINPARGSELGDTWAKRVSSMEQLDKDIKRTTDGL